MCIQGLWASFTFFGVVYFVLFDFSFSTVRFTLFSPRLFSFSFTFQWFPLSKHLEGAGSARGVETIIITFIINNSTNTMYQVMLPSLSINHDILLIGANY